MFLFAIRVGIIPPTVTDCKYSDELIVFLLRWCDWVADNQDLVAHGIRLTMAYDCFFVGFSGHDYLDCWQFVVDAADHNALSVDSSQTVNIVGTGDIGISYTAGGSLQKNQQ